MVFARRERADYRTRMTSRLVPDAHLAALAMQDGLTLQSTDGDFAKVPALKWESPLAA
jgi:uncharacterized protein